jgi:hypothetical protein
MMARGLRWIGVRRGVLACSVISTEDKLLVIWLHEGRLVELHQLLPHLPTATKAFFNLLSRPPSQLFLESPLPSTLPMHTRNCAGTDEAFLPLNAFAALPIGGGLARGLILAATARHAQVAARSIHLSRQVDIPDTKSLTIEHECPHQQDLLMQALHTPP